MASQYAPNKEAWSLSEVVIERLAQQGPWSRALEILDALCARSRCRRLVAISMACVDAEVLSILAKTCRAHHASRRVVATIQHVPLNREQGEHLYAQWGVVV